MSGSNTLTKPGLTRYEQASKDTIEFFRDLRLAVNNQANRHCHELTKTIRAADARAAEVPGGHCAVEISRYFEAVTAAIEFMTTTLKTESLKLRLYDILATQPLSILATPYMKSMYEFLDIKYGFWTNPVDGEVQKQIILKMKFEGLNNLNKKGVCSANLGPAQIYDQLNTFEKKQAGNPGAHLGILSACVDFANTYLAPYEKRYGNPDALLTDPAFFTFYTTNGKISNVGFGHIA